MQPSTSWIKRETQLKNLEKVPILSTKPNPDVLTD